MIVFHELLLGIWLYVLKEILRYASWDLKEWDGVRRQCIKPLKGHALW